MIILNNKTVNINSGNSAIYYNNIFYGTTNSFWNTASNWSLGIVPIASHNVVIAKDCVVNTGSTVKRLTINNNVTLSFDSTVRTVTVTEFINSFGTLNMSNANHRLSLLGENNSITGTFIAGTGTISYDRIGNQNIMNLNYYNLSYQIVSNSQRYLSNTINVYGLFYLGACTCNNFSINCYNGFQYFGGTLNSNINFLANQIWGNSTFQQTINGNINIADNITVTTASGMTGIVNGIINGLTSTSTLTLNNSNFTYRNNQRIMQTGIFNAGLTNSILYNVSTPFNISNPSDGSFSNVTLQGSNVTLNNNLKILTLLAFPLTINGFQIEVTGNNLGSVNAIINSNLLLNTVNKNIGTSPHNITLNGTTVIDNIAISSQASLFSINNTINGTNGSSILNNTGAINYQSATAPMVTGQLQCNNALNTFRYNRSGNQDVLGGTYRIINFGGSGVKKLLGNVIINVTGGGSQSTTGSATVDLNGYTITTI